jgi:hypothetical protein
MQDMEDPPVRPVGVADPWRATLVVPRVEGQMKRLGVRPRPTSAHGSLLCQDAAGRGVLGCEVAGPGSGFSEEPVWGCEPVALETES